MPNYYKFKTIQTPNMCEFKREPTLFQRVPTGKGHLTQFGIDRPRTLEGIEYTPQKAIDLDFLSQRTGTNYIERPGPGTRDAGCPNFSKTNSNF